MVGSPSGVAPSPPDLVEVEVGGKKFKVAPDAADAFLTREKELVNQLVRRPTDDLPPLRKPDEKPPEGDATKTSFGDRFFVDPDGAMAEFRKGIMEELRGEYGVEKSRERFWQTFYAKNTDLADYDFLVKAVMARDWSQLENLTGEQALDELAKRTKAAILKLGGTKPAAGDSTPGLEGGSRRTPPNRQASADAEGEQPYGLSAAIRRRKQDRRNHK